MLVEPGGGVDEVTIGAALTDFEVQVWTVPGLVDTGEVCGSR